MLRLALLILLLASPAAAQSIPVHGNWCGPGYSGGYGGGYGPAPAPPTDPLDAACMRHDLCKTYRGQFDCGCDLSLMRELRASRWPNPGIAAKARAIYEAIGMTPCSSPDGYALKMALITGDWADDVASGRQAPWEILNRLSRLASDGLANGRW